MADKTTETQTPEKGTEGETVETAPEREHGVPEPVARKWEEPPTPEDAAVDKLMADLELEGGTPPADADPQDADPAEPTPNEPTAREKELQDRLSAQGREIKELRQMVQGSNDPTQTRRPESTGDPTQDNINLLGDAFVELDNRLQQQEQTQTAIDSYLDEGISRQKAKELVQLEQSTDVNDRIAWRREYNKATQEVQQQRERGIQSQQSRDFAATSENNGSMPGGRSPSTTHNPAQVAKKLAEKYPSGRDRVQQVALLESRFGEDFADEVLNSLNMLGS